MTENDDRWGSGGGESAAEVVGEEAGLSTADELRFLVAGQVESGSGAGAGAESMAGEAGMSPGANGQYGAAGWQVSYALAGVRQSGDRVGDGESASDPTRFGDQGTADERESGRRQVGSGSSSAASASEQVVRQANSGESRRKRLGMLVVAGVVVIVAVVVGVTVSSRVSQRAVVVQVTPSAPVEATISPDTSATEPVIRGYQGVAVPAFGIGYDVPTGWVVEPAHTTWTIGGFTGRGQADEGARYCPGSGYRAVATLTDSGQGDPARAATAVGTTAAQTSYGGSGGGTATPAVELTTRSGITGQYVETSGTWTPSRTGCSTTTFSVYTFAFRGASGSVLVLTILADRGTQGELTPAQAHEILTSVRDLR
ncbi:hypothetical protein [Nocardia macrotermitis]|uniref:hypothetical protein n=1 Tax=Nocardia macrotermitis TaxID=2585198 RepID=UPI001294A9CB|nr:hypothetical protein [Nocardia macrotermitis]